MWLWINDASIGPFCDNASITESTIADCCLPKLNDGPSIVLSWMAIKRNMTMVGMSFTAGLNHCIKTVQHYVLYQPLRYV